MSRENVEVVRQLYEAFLRRDNERPFELLDPDIEWDASRMPVQAPGSTGVYRGHQGVRAFWREWLSPWRDLKFEIQDVLDAGDDVVLLIRNQRQWGRHSGIETALPPYAQVLTFRNGKVVRWRAFPDQQSALEAVGLSE
jgi:ketosteroid isomerase-like protein